MSQSLLIIGAGYIGKHLASLASTTNFGITPHTVNRQEADDSDSYIPCAQKHVADVSDLASLLKLKDSLKFTPDTIVHCASSGRGGGLAAYQNVYLKGIQNLVTAFPSSHLIYTSSTSVYGQTKGELVTETSAATPTKDTGKVLRQAENACLQAQGTVLRLAGIYGPKRSMILKNFQLGKANLEEDGSRYINQIHQHDAATAILHAAQHPQAFKGEIFNVTDSTPITQQECYEYLSKALNAPMPTPVPKKLNSKRGWTHKRVSNEKLRQSGWVPKYADFFQAVESVLPTIEV